MGIVFALLSMLCFAGNIFITRAAMLRMGATIRFPVVLLVNVAFAALVFGIERVLTHSPFLFHWAAAGWFALSGVVGIYLGRRMLLDAVHILGPARASVLHTASPVVTLIAAWFLVGEQLGMHEFLLIAVVVFVAGGIVQECTKNPHCSAKCYPQILWISLWILPAIDIASFAKMQNFRGRA